MIYLKEQIPIKLPGEVSFSVVFKFDQRIVDVMHQIPNAIWHKKLKEWEIPATSLSRAIQLLRNFDSLDLTFLEPTDEEVTVPEVHGNFKSKPFDYQLDGIKFGLQNDKWLLLDAPGLGKTLQMIYLAQELKERGEIEHCLVVCGVNALKYNWKAEIEKHSDLSVKILGERLTKKKTLRVGGIADRLKDLKEPIEEFFVITNVETLRNKDIVDELTKGKNKFDMIVADEMHKMKTVSAQQSKGFLKLDAKYKVGLTGTLLTNNPLDAYVPLKWIGADNSTLTNFKYYYCEFGGFNGTDIIGYKNTDVLKDQLSYCSLRRTKDLLDLPPKTVIQEYVEMEESQKGFYWDVVWGITDKVNKVDLNPANILSMTTRLRQATSCPWILTNEDVRSAKVTRAVDLTREIVDNGDKVIIFSVFKDPLTVLKGLLQDLNPVLITGDVSDDIVEMSKVKFQTDDNCKVMLATTQKAGTGLTLTAASYAIFLDTPWTAAEFEQAQDRIHRIGANKSVFIYELITKDTVDERVHEIVKDKEAIADFIIDNKVTKRSLESLKKYILDL